MLLAHIPSTAFCGPSAVVASQFIRPLAGTVLSLTTISIFLHIYAFPLLILLSLLQEPHAVIVAFSDDEQGPALHLAALAWSSIKTFSRLNSVEVIELDSVSNCNSPHMWLGAYPHHDGDSGVLFFDVFTSFVPNYEPSEGFCVDLRRFSCSQDAGNIDIKLHDMQRVIHSEQGDLVCIVAGNDSDVSRCVVQRSQFSDMENARVEHVSCLQLLIRHTLCPMRENANDALMSLLLRYSPLDDSKCEYVQHLKAIVASEDDRLDAIRHVVHAVCIESTGFNLENALELLYVRFRQLRNLWFHLLNQSSKQPNACIGQGQDPLREYREIEIANHYLAACHRIIFACSAVNEMQFRTTQSHSLLDCPHPHPICAAFYSGGGIFHQLSLDYIGCPVNSDADAVMLFVNNPAASELLNVSAWARPDKSLLDNLHCCNLAACIYGSYRGKNVPSVSHRREHDSVQPGVGCSLPIGSTCAALRLRYECHLVRGSCDVVIRTGSLVLSKGMIVSGAYIQPGTTLSDFSFDAKSFGSTILRLSIPHMLQDRESANSVLVLTPNDAWIDEKRAKCFSTLLHQVTFLKNLFTTSQFQQLDDLARQPYPDAATASASDPSQSSPLSLLDVARTALVACSSALVELAPTDVDRANAVILEEEIMQGLYDLIRCSAFDEETFGVLLDISCNAYHRASNGGAGLKIGLKEDAIARALMLFNYVDVHDDVHAELRRKAFMRCLSNAPDLYSQLLQSSTSLTHETLILQAYVYKCLCSEAPMPNPFGIPLPQYALSDAEWGPPCVPHSYQAHSCFIILCDLAQFLYSPSSKDCHGAHVNPSVSRLVIDVFLCRLHMPHAPWNGSAVTAGDAQLLLHVPLTHDFCYVGWRLCCWLMCGRLPQHLQTQATSGDEMSGVLAGAFSPGVTGKPVGISKQDNMLIMTNLPPCGDMGRAYWNACDGGRRDVSSRHARETNAARCTPKFETESSYVDRRMPRRRACSLQRVAF